MTPSSASGAIASTSSVDEIAVVLAVPEQHDVDDLVGVLVDHLLAGVVLDRVAQVLVDVVVVADLHDDHAGLAGPSARQHPARCSRGELVLTATSS